ncbi:unnamed protein product [Allacma fusca]|uniref:Phosphatidylserine decarboxylase proenzyme, mitochondrial n=1 Tax=Allacma fusca TaxID=39272 RepID=A0A8J2J700_9HEXA|nr:unnamed protein product [Allacma fusca]
MLVELRSLASWYLIQCLKLIWCTIRTFLVVLNNFYCIPTYVYWLIILSPLSSVHFELYREIEGVLFHWLLSMVGFWSYSAGYNIIETGDVIDDIVHKEALVIANHQSTSDVPLMMAAFSTRPGLLPHLNWIMDRLFKYTNFGVVSTFHDDFFISAGRDKREATVRELGQYLINTYIPYRRKWLVLFPEGGFLRKRRTASQRYAEKNGLPMLEHVTLPRMGALQMILETMGPKPLASGDRADPSDVPNNNLELQSGYLRYIVDLTIAYPKGNPLSLVDVITGYASTCVIRFHYRIYNIKDVPTDKQKLQDWLFDRYSEKEKMLANYYETGEWKAFSLSEKQEEGVVKGKFTETTIQRLVEQDLLRDNLTGCNMSGSVVNVSVKRNLKRKYSYKCSSQFPHPYDEKERIQDGFSWTKFLKFSIAFNLLSLLSLKCNVQVCYPDKQRVSHVMLLIPRLCKQTVQFTFSLVIAPLRRSYSLSETARSAFRIIRVAQIPSTRSKTAFKTWGWQIKCYRMMPLKSLSNAWGFVNNINLPIFLRPIILNLYVRAFGCDLAEAEIQDLKCYRNLGEFFRRSLKIGVRPIDQLSPIVSPVDGRVLHFGEVDDGIIEQVKGVTYSISQFLGPPTWTRCTTTNDSSHSDCQDYTTTILHHKNGTSLFHCVIYLAPGDYHRFHSPVEWNASFRRHFAGELLSVNPRIARMVNGLFSLNERAVYTGTWEHGFFSFTAVGATNVGSIRVYEDIDLQTNVRRQPKGHYKDKFFEKSLQFKKGENIGEFNLGSTVILIFEAPSDFSFSLQHGNRVKVGHSIVQHTPIQNEL